MSRKRNFSAQVKYMNKSAEYHNIHHKDYKKSKGGILMMEEKIITMGDRAAMSYLNSQQRRLTNQRLYEQINLKWRK